MKNCSYNLKRVKAISVLAAVALLFVMLFSSLYISENLNHHCTCEEDNCPICEMISLIDNTVRQLGSALPVVSGVLCTVFVLKTVLNIFNGSLIRSNPVSWKIRLNN